MRRLRALRVRRCEDDNLVVGRDDGAIAQAAYPELDVLPLVAQHRGDTDVRVQLRGNLC